MAKRRWEIDWAALRVATVRLGLRHKVDVKITSQRKTTGRYKGLHRQPDGTRLHQVTISTHQCPTEAGKALWHEITHCQQRERYRTALAFSRGLANDDLEDEAYAAERWNRQIPLCRPR